MQLIIGFKADYLTKAFKMYIEKGKYLKIFIWLYVLRSL